MAEKPTMNTDHVVAHDGLDGLPYAMECLHCGDVQPVALPIPIDLWVAMGEKYEAIHAKCRPRKKGKGKS